MAAKEPLTIVSMSKKDSPIGVSICSITDISVNGRTFKLDLQKMKHIKQTADLKVFISTRDSTCDECGENLGRGKVGDVHDIRTFGLKNGKRRSQ
jgi:hypothetical protein